MKALHESKNAGLDDLPPGIFIHAVDILLPLMWHLFNILWNSGEFPDSRGLSCLIPLHKKGDTNYADSYRGISLLDVFGKIYASIIIRRVINRRVIFFAHLYSKISESQAGFREGYSTIDNVFILQSLILSKYLSKQCGKLYVAFVDLNHILSL